MIPRNNKIVLLGAGNVATQLGTALQENDFPVIQVYSRTLPAAKTLGEKLETAYTSDIKAVFPDAGIYLFAVKDSALSEVAAQLPHSNGLWVHVAGSIPVDIFSACSDRKGVLYPLQTFNKNRKISFQNIPLFVEANNPDDEDLLDAMARRLSGRVIRLSSEKREYLHLAAVFACNFTNHLYALAAKILETNGLEWDLLSPLIYETASKVAALHPLEAQTGPAVRGDKNVMDRQLELLNAQPDLQALYRLLSESIYFEGICHCGGLTP
jgi:predicted short-subunit dehydrogenase-like oxidoreductase (DUF2520 family)